MANRCGLFKILKVTKIMLNEAYIRKIAEKVILELFIPKTKEERLIKESFQIGDIPENVFENQWKLMEVFPIPSYDDGIVRIVGGKVIEESVSRTIPPNETMNIIRKRFLLEEWQIKVVYAANGIKILILLPNNVHAVNEIKAAMKMCGWSFFCIQYLFERGKMMVGLSFDPIYQDNISNIVRQQCDGFLYHWSPFCRYQSILESGLVPRSENSKFKYPARLHLLKGNVSDTIRKGIGRQLCKCNTSPENDGRYVLFNIDLSKIPPETEIYFDPRFEYGVYMKEPISPMAIGVEYGYNFNTERYFYPDDEIDDNKNGENK